MSKYIEKESLLKYIDNTVPWNSPGDRLLVYLEISDFETADVAPVAHGKWLNEDFPEKTATVNDFAICSVCGEMSHKAEHGYAILSKYCPECGAKMDLE